MLEGVVLAVLERVLGAYIASVLTKGSTRRRKDEILAVASQYFERLSAVSDEVVALRVAMQELDLLVRHHPMLHWAGDELVVGTAVDKKPSERIVSAQEALMILHREVERRRAETGVLAKPPTGASLVPARNADLAVIDDLHSLGREGTSAAPPASVESDIENWTAEVNRLHSEVRRERRRRSS